MHTPIVTGLTAALAVSLCPACAKPPARPGAAASAEQFGRTASYRAPAREHGYDARARHIADCLATYPGYDPRTDRVPVRPGVTRACGL